MPVAIMTIMTTVYYTVVRLGVPVNAIQPDLPYRPWAKPVIVELALIIGGDMRVAGVTTRRYVTGYSVVKLEFVHLASFDTGD